MKEHWLGILLHSMDHTLEAMLLQLRSAGLAVVAAVTNFGQAPPLPSGLGYCGLGHQSA